MSIILKNLPMSNVKEKFNAISKTGNFKSVVGTIGHSDGHAQGSSYYVDNKNQKYFIVAHDGKYNGKKSGYGYLMIYPESPELVEPYDIKTPFGYNHPGSFQIIGDYLFLPIEDYDSSFGAEQDKGCQVVVYDLKNLANNKAPEVCAPILELKNHRAGMLGVTDKWIAIGEGSKIHLYHIDELSHESFKVTSYGKKWLRDFQGIGLVEQLDESNNKKLFLIGLVSDPDIKYVGPYRDGICLYEIAPETENGNSFTYTEIGCVDVSTDHGNGMGGPMGIHFRYGGGIYLYENNDGDVHMICLGTGRDIADHDDFNYNEFPSEERIEILSKQKPLDGQKHRSSKNFAIKGFTNHKRVKFTVYDQDGKEDTEGKIKFDIYMDVSGGIDDMKYENVKNGEVRYDSEDSPLYVHSPSPEANQTFRIVIEGTSDPHS